MSERRKSTGADRAVPDTLLTRVAVLLAVGFGLLFAALTPPYDAPDEPRHFGRVYMLSEGRIGVPGLAPGRGASLPAELGRLHPPRPAAALCRHDTGALFAQLRRPLDAERRANAVQLTTRFSPVPYATQAIAVAIARAAGGSATALLYVARLANLLTFAGLMWLALALAPARHALLAAVALLPMSVFLAASVTADATTTGLAMLFVALVLRTSGADTRPAPPWRRFAPLLLAAAALGLTKPGYGLVAAAAFAIPPAVVGNRRDHAGLVALCAALALVPGLAWALYVESGQPHPLGPEADVLSQLTNVLTHPFAFLGVLARTVAHEALAWGAGAIGVLGWLDLALPVWIYLTAPLVLAGAALLGEAGASAPRLHRTFAAVAAATFLGLLVLGYLAWNPVGAPYVADVHGRYLLPLLPLLGAALRPRRALDGPTVAALGVYWVLALGATALALAGRYWTAP